MLERFTATFLWDKRLSKNAQWAWFAFVALAPFALCCGFLLQRQIVSQVPVRLEMDRATAVQAARDLAKQRGLDTANWLDRVKVEEHWNLYRYLAAKPSGKILLNQLGTWSIAHVTLQPEDGPQKVELFVGLGGKIDGYKITFADGAVTGRTLSESEATVVADAAIDSRRKSVPGATFGERILRSSPSTSDSSFYRFEYPATFGGFTELSGKITLRIRGDQIVEDTFDLTLPESAVPREGKKLRSFLKGLYGFILTVLFVFVMVRYIKRRVQREAPRERLYLVALVLTIFLSVNFYLSEILPERIDTDIPFPAWLPLFMLFLGAMVIGLVAGVSYAGCEGDLREKFPSLLTSLDAWLCGFWTSRNVGRAVVLGSAVLGWLLLTRNTIYLLGNSSTPGLDSLSGANSELLTRVPWLAVLSNSVSSAIFICIGILLGPITFLIRYTRKQKWLFLFLVPLAWLGISALGDEPLRFPYSALVSLTQVGGLIACFFLVDFFACVILATGYTFLVTYASVGTIAPLWEKQDAIAYLIAGSVVASGILSMWLGRVVSDDEVRPAYAREIQERLQLQSEVEAAREAQQRLLPAGPPEIPGLSVAASCRPAEAVSGDFYDFFPIGKTKLGILMSDGGGNGLATALTIALAKGYLMHKAQACHGPMETLRGLHATLGQQLQGMNAEGLCYLILDLDDCSIRMARIGDTPAILLAGERGAIAESRHEANGVIWWEASARLQPEHRAILYTNGLCRLIGEPDQSAANRWLLRRLKNGLQLPVSALHEFLLKTIFTRGAGLGSRTVKDDVTVIVLSIDRQAAVSMEHVA